MWGTVVLARCLAMMMCAYDKSQLGACAKGYAVALKIINGLYFLRFSVDLRVRTWIKVYINLDIPYS